MADFIPYFAGLITLLFGAGFGYAITDGWNLNGKKKK